MLKANEISPEQIEQKQLYREMGLSDQEYDMVKDILKRRPNYTETGIFSVMWSEHCSYKTSKPLLKKFPTEGPQVLQGPGEGAGVVDIGDNQAVVFKIESHNHPSAVTPYHGAATGVGGIIRDIFSMGARPIASMNSLRFGSLENKRVKEIYEGVVAGIAGYGNDVGVPTVGGEIHFDDSYEENPLVNAMVVGLLKHDEIQKGVAAGVGNTVIYAGASTGREGIHGATFASDDLEEGENRERPNPTIGNPHLEKLLIEACLEAIHCESLVGIQDMGAAGLTSSASEMASKAGTGMEMDLDLVPQAEENMSAYDLMLSETQERMLLVVKKGEEQEIFDIFEKYGVQAVAIGEVIEEKTFRIKQDGEVKADIPVDALAEDAPVYYLPSEEATYYKEFQQIDVPVPAVENYGEVLKQLLQQPSIASKGSVYAKFDTGIENNTIVGPGSDAAVVQIPGTDKAIAITTDCNARYIYLDPEVGGKIAVAEAARNIVCSGARPLAITDGLNYGNPTNPEVFWQMEKSVDGISEACRVLDTPVISGNVSLYNQSRGISILPTPIVGMVGLMETTEYATTSFFKQSGDLIYLVGETKSEFGGSELQLLSTGKIEGKAPEIDLQIEVDRQRQLLAAIQDGVVQSAHDLAEGGLAVALAESAFANVQLGADVTISGNSTVQLFSESQSRFLVSVQKEHQAQFEERVQQAVQIGEVTETGSLVVRNGEQVIVDEKVETLNKLWKEALPNLVKSQA